MASTTRAQTGPARANESDRVKHIHHGRTLAAWVGSLVSMVAFIIGGIAVMVQNWPLFWAGVALLIIGLIVTKVLQVTGHGAR